ncbi:MAG TPA: ATP synthase F1 subunit gamma [Vicinamibacterales bacterium]|jgi:F-type H+-transporting ATPase subunit gamma|nr:ATP synthase F1 subunit gamma [Vicinamibacterales bacterium]
MPSLIDIRRRVRAVRSTQQITKAMKMVSSSKLRRAQERIVKSRPYAKEMLRVFNNLATRTENATHPLLNDDPLSARTLLIVITADRGLCGSFNTNVAKATMQFVVEQPKDPQGRDVAMALVGRKGRDFFRRRGFDVLYEEVGLFQNVKWSHAQAIAQTAIKEFLGPDVSSVYLIYNEFRSVISQRVVIEKLLPIPRLNEAEAANNAASGKPLAGTVLEKPADASASAAVDYLFEPDPKQLLDLLLPMHVGVQVQRALLESAAAEHAARMQSMDSATKNAKEMVDRLTLYMNKVRQAAITREIIEVVSGAQAT